MRQSLAILLTVTSYTLVGERLRGGPSSEGLTTVYN
jgi:hypothetical protein